MWSVKWVTDRWQAKLEKWDKIMDYCQILVWGRRRVKRDSKKWKKGVNMSNIANNVQSRMSTHHIMANIHTQVMPFSIVPSHPHTKKHVVHIANVKTAVELRLFLGQLNEDLLSNSGALERGSECFGCSHQSSLSWTNCHCCLWISWTHHTESSHRPLPPKSTPATLPLYWHRSKQIPENQHWQNQPETDCIRTGKAAVKYKVHLQCDMYNRMHLMLQNESKSLWVHEPSAMNCINFQLWKMNALCQIIFIKQDYIVSHKVFLKKSLLYILFTENDSSFSAFIFVSMINSMC